MPPQQLSIVKEEPLKLVGPPPGPKPLSIAEERPVAGGGRGGPPPSAPPTSGRGGGPGDTKLAAATPPPSAPFYPGGGKAAAQDFAGMVGGGLAAVGAGALLPALAPVAGVAAVGRMLPWAARATRTAAGVVGAGAGGAGAAAVTGSPATDPSGGGDSVWDAFKRQAEMEAIGAGVGGFAAAVGRRAIAGRVATKAREGLEWIRSTEMTSVRELLERAQDALRGHATRGALRRQTTTEATTALGEAAQQAKTEARGAFGAATAEQAGLAPKIEGIRARGATAEEAARARWPASESAVASPLTPPPGPRAVPPALSHGGRAAQAAEQVIRGPVAGYKRRLGEAVESAAESGPPVRVDPLLIRLNELSEQATPSVLQAGGGAVDRQTLAAESLVAQNYARDLNQAKLILARNPDAGAALAEIPPELHLPAALSYARELLTKSGADTIPFADAHKLKRLLDDVVNWDRGAKKIREQATKGFRQTLRESMAGHTDYDTATAAYRDITRRLGDKSLAGRLQRVARDNPDALVSSLFAGKKALAEPERLRLFKEVLIGDAAAGGGAEAGREAWQAVQSAVMFEHLIKPGLDTFEKSVAKMHPEFLHLLTEDPYARQVFDRLRTMSEAVASIRQQTAMEMRGARETTRAAVAAHKATGQAARGRQWQAEGTKSQIARQGEVEAAQHAVEGQALQTDRQRAARAVQHASLATPAERAFADAKLSTQHGLGAQLSDAVYAATAPVGSPRQAAGAVRTFVAGPRVNELIQWASLSPSGTQMFVRAVTGPAPGLAVAAMIRLMNWMGGEMPPEPVPAHGLPKGSPLTPPPGPRGR